MSDLLMVEDVSKTFPSGDSTLVVLNELGLTVEKGAMVAITGASGSGKSTLLHLLGGMDRPDKGRIIFQNQDIVCLGRKKLAQYRNMEIGFVFQSHHLQPEFRALENVMMPLLMRRIGTIESRSRASEMLGLVGLADRKSHRPGELSGGEQQRVALARALVGAPRLLLADEPTGNLDTGTSHQVHTLIRQLHMELGLTSIIVSHDRGLARLCDAAWELKFGALGAISCGSTSAGSL